jgi:hypothetical protein
MTTPVDFTPLARSAVGPSHFAKLCGASRISVYKWLSGQASPRGLYLDRVKKVLKRLDNAVEKGTLPLPPTRRADKYAAVIRALQA